MKAFKTLGIAVIAVFVFTSTKCTKKIRIDKTLDGATIEFIVIPQAAGNFDYSANETFDLEKELQKFDISLSTVKSVKAESATITIMDTTLSPITFDIVDMVNIDLGTTTIPFRKAAWKDPVPHTGAISMQPDVDPNFDVLPLIKTNEMSYHFTGKLNKALDHQVKLKIVVKWNVVAEI